MVCGKCSGLARFEETIDESFKKMTVKRCLNCGKIDYPPMETPPVRFMSKKGGRKGIPFLKAYQVN